MAVRYIGSKARLAEAIVDIIGDPKDGSSHLIDAFCGTGVVARTAALRGWNVSGNDTLLSSTYLADASLYSTNELDFSRIGSYEIAVERLNKASLRRGFIWRTNKEIFGVRVNPEMVGFKGMAHFADALCAYVKPLMLCDKVG